MGLQDTIRTLNNLATLIDNQGRHKEAEPLYQECWLQRKNVYSPIVLRAPYEITGTEMPGTDVQSGMFHSYEMQSTDVQ
eukprot:1728908-Rhodomonas_salina.1